MFVIYIKKLTKNLDSTLLFFLKGNIIKNQYIILIDCSAIDMIGEDHKITTNGAGFTLCR
jgi:hypothetical protein